MFDASNNNLAVVVNQPCLFHLSGDHAHNHIGFDLVDVDPSTALGHRSLMRWMEDFPNPTLSASIQDFSPHPVSVMDGAPIKLLHNSNGDGNDVLPLDTLGGAMTRDDADIK